MSMKKMILSCVLIFCSFALYANALKNLSDALKQVKSAKASFKQTIITADGQVLQAASGQMLILKPGYFSWKITKPNQQLILIRLGKVYLYQKELQQLTVKPFNVNATQTPAALLLNGNLSILKQQYTAEETQTRQGRLFTLLPKDNHQLLQKITITFRGDRLVSLNLFDHFNRVTNVIFTAFKLNPPLASDAFHFSPPKGTDILHA